MTQATMRDEKIALLYCQTRDSAHLVNLMARYCGPLHAFVGRYATPAVADAVLKATFRGLVRHLESGQPLQNIQAWLFAEARRIAAPLR